MSASAVAPADATVATADGGRRPRRRAWPGWVAIAIVLILAGSVGAAIAQSAQTGLRDRFDPDSAGPDGTRALARILDQHGVAVEIVRDRDAAARALAAGPATLVLPDSPFVSDALFAQLADAATDVVVADPASRGVRLLFGARVAGFGTTDAVAPRCALAEAERAGAVVVGATFTEASGATGCYPTGDGYGLLAAGRDGEDGSGGRVVAVDGTELFTNAHLAENGNAALAVGLMGRLDRLVWYVPTLADSDAGAATLGELTPRWVSPAIVLLLGAVIAAAVWRGRRFGPLVAETLPVTVRAGETTEGRARLYANARDPQHAARALQAAASARLARVLGLPATASADAVADAAAARTGRDRREVRDALGAAPRSDRELVELARSLHDLETAVEAAVRPGPLDVLGDRGDELTDRRASASAARRREPR